MKNENLVPKVRFKGFSDPWEQRKLKNISLEIGTGKSRFIKFNKSEKYMYKILGSTSIIGYTNHFDYEGDFILTARVGANAGTIYRESGKVKISDNTVFIKASQINFLYYVLTNYNLKRLSFGTGQPLIKSSELNKLKLEVPTNGLEQQELGVIFFTIDTLIAANEDKLEQLKTLKKLMMQKIFSQEWRFKGFTDPWEQRKLGELSNGFTYGLNASAKAYDGKHQYLRITDIDDETRTFKQTHLTSPDIDFIRDNSYVLKLGDIVFTRTGASTGKTFIYRTADSIVYYAGFLIKMSVREDIDSEFVFQNTLTTSFNRFVKVMSQRSGQPGINSKEYARFKLYIPKLKEQVLVGNMLLLIDNLIAANEDKLNQLKELKKYLMQNMFV
ncbi:restriction endonuclease subunit S [Lactiplantibacillus plantarum]|uniref:restriction endonuclease subunit S n=1 Tax=Lactiplantibacillus plantarum TaxID=1590 RepID=UPI001559D9B8|nr:restriction endonuclease subunit S [Lactiplantibacillus plantarum]QJS45607.1 restriction endonuclease subunit S [Lactiplantibacillus plantarum]